MLTVGSYEAKTHLPSLLEQVARGERVTITRHGVPVAMLVPAQPSSGLDRRQAIEALRSFRRGRRSAPGEVAEMIRSGRR